MFVYERMKMLLIMFMFCLPAYSIEDSRDSVHLRRAVDFACKTEAGLA